MTNSKGSGPSRPVAAQGRQARLAELVSRLLDAAVVEGSPSGEMEAATMFQGRYAGELSIAGDQGGVEAAAEELFQELGPNSGFQGSWEVVCYCLDRLKDVQDSSPDNEAAADAAQVAAHLTKPLRAYEFEVAYPTVSSFAFDWSVAGPNSIRARVALGKEGQALLSIQGALEAATREGAILVCERLLDVVLGAARTVGTVRFLESRSPTAERPFVSLKSVSPRRPEDDFPAPLAAVYGDRLFSLRFDLPRDRSELEAAVLLSGDLTQALARHQRAFAKVLAGTSQRAQEVRNACRLAINAEHSNDFGVLISLASACLEGLLLEAKTHDTITARLAEAVAHSVGTTPEEKKALRALTKKLYDVRSSFVHTGMVGETFGLRVAALDLMYRVLRREVEALPEVASERSGVPK